MDIYKQASRVGLRIATPKGMLSVEQLWTLSQNNLASSIKEAKSNLKTSEGEDELGFLEETNSADPIAQLCFDILKDVYLTKKSEAEAIRDAASIKAHNQKILGLIAEKQEEGLKGMSIAELEAQLK